MTEPISTNFIHNIIEKDLQCERLFEDATNYTSFSNLKLNSDFEYQDWEIDGEKVDNGRIVARQSISVEQRNLDEIAKEAIDLLEKLDETITRLSVLWQTAKQDTYNDYTDYTPYIGWYLAIAYLEDYDKDKAKDILAEMEELYPASTIMGNKVRNLLKEI